MKKLIVFLLVTLAFSFTCVYAFQVPRILSVYLCGKVVNWSPTGNESYFSWRETSSVCCFVKVYSSFQSGVNVEFNWNNGDILSRKSLEKPGDLPNTWFVYDCVKIEELKVGLNNVRVSVLSKGEVVDSVKLSFSVDRPVKGRIVGFYVEDEMKVGVKYPVKVVVQNLSLIHI